MSMNAWIQEAIDHTMRFKRSQIAAGEGILEAAETGRLKMPKKRLTRAELYER